MPPTLRALRPLRTPKVRLVKRVDLSLPPEFFGRTAAMYRRVVSLTAEAISDDLAPWIRQHSRHDAVYPGDFAAMLERVRAKMGAEAVDAALVSVAKAVDDLSFARLARVPGIDPGRIIQGGPREIDRFRRVNAALIQSVPQQMAQDVAATLAELDVSSLTVRDIAKILEERFSVYESKALFWARDQTLKLYARIQENRQRAAGASRYQWEHSGDERVRGRPDGIWNRNSQNHWVLGNTIQSWDLPPITNPNTGSRAHPGGDPQCRCSAYPLFDGDPVEVAPPKPFETTPEQEAADFIEATLIDE